MFPLQLMKRFSGFDMYLPWWVAAALILSTIIALVESLICFTLRCLLVLNSIVTDIVYVSYIEMYGISLAYVSHMAYDKTGKTDSTPT